MNLRFASGITAVVVSFGLHLGIAGLWPDRQVILPGGSMAGEIALGSSFANLAMGRLHGSVDVDEITPSVDVETATRVPGVMPSTAPDSPVPPLNVTPFSANAANIDRIAPATAEMISVPTALTPATVSHLAARPETAQTTPTEAREVRAPARSARPVARPPQRQRPNAPITEGPAVRRGNAEVTAAIGQRSGTSSGTVSQSTRAEQTSARQAGQGEINDYKSRVAARVIRVAERMRSRGSEGNVVVGIQITPSGRLASATIVESSGSATADAIARNAILRAAPFDPPPHEQPIVVRFRVRLVSD